MTRKKRQHRRAEEYLEEAESKVQGVISTIEWQRENLKQSARDANNAHLSMPTASDNRISLDSLYDALARVYDAIELVSLPVHVGIEHKKDFYQRIETLRQKRIDIDNRNNIDGKEELCMEILELVEDAQEWREEMEEEHTI